MFKIELTKWQFADIAQKMFGLKFSSPGIYALYEFYSEEEETELCFGDIDISWSEYLVEDTELLLDDYGVDSIEELVNENLVLKTYDYDGSVYSYLVCE